jgi:hypothetical protein
MFDEPQIGLPGSNRLLVEQIQMSGLVHTVDPFTVLAIGSMAAKAIGGISKANAEKKQAQARNKYTKIQDKFNKKKWTYNKKKLQAHYEHLKEGVDIQRQNAATNAAYRDEINWQSWNHDLMIRNMEQEGLNAQYEKSQQLYHDQINLNSASARMAVEKEYDRLGDIEREKSFEFQDAQLQNLLKSDAIKAKGVRGLSADKSVQAQEAAYGRNIAIMVEALTSNRRDVESTLKRIAHDQNAADMAAFAQKMLKPGVLPMRAMPIQTPIPVLQDPRQPTKYDFGPKPIKGFQVADQSGQTLLQTGINAVTSVASFAGGGFDGNTWQGYETASRNYLQNLAGTGARQ